MEQETVCFINTFYDEECHKNSYGEVAKEIVLVSEFGEEYQQLLRLRICNEIDTICKYHLRKYIDKYVHIFGQKCCDPFQIHKKICSKKFKRNNYTACVKQPKFCQQNKSCLREVCLYKLFYQIIFK